MTRESPKEKSMNIPGIHPIFVTGVYRTGTTLFSRILDAHSALNVTYDSVHFMRFCHGQFDPIHERASYVALLQDIKARCDARWAHPVDIDPVIQRLDAAHELEYATVYHEAMNHLLGCGGRASWGEKTLLAWSKIPVFLDMFPNGKVFQVVRDPRDVVSSNKFLTYEPGLRYLDGVFACLSSMKAAADLERSVPEGSYMTVRYEDLVRRPALVAERVCAMVGVPFEESMVDPASFRDLTGGTFEKNTSYKGVSNTISDESVGKYKEHLSRVEIHFIEMIARTVMERFEYEFEGPVLDKGEWEELFSVVSDEFISERYSHWLKTNEGVESYPSPPPRVLRDGPVDETDGGGRR